MKNAKVTITSALLAIAAFSSMADAKCAFTKPVEGDTYAAGDTLPIQWIDDGTSPGCSDMNIGIELRVGSQDAQDVAATVTPGVPGSAGSASFVIPQELQKTDSTYFLEMHKKDAPADFQNFSARFTITGVKAASGDSGSTDSGSNSTDTNTGDSSSSDSSSSSDNNSTDTTDSNDTQNNGKPSKGSSANKNSAGDSSTSSDPSSSNASGASGSTSPSNSTNSNPQQANAASSSWSASFTSLAIVAVGAVLSNVF